MVNDRADTHILTRFPTPPGSVLKALELLQVVRRGDPKEMAEYGGELTDLPRPWDPATCPPVLRTAVWGWCDTVAEWINHEYAWRPTHVIPPCWPRHAHIAHELPILAIARWTAEQSTTHDAIDDWHRYALPMFYERMHDRLGESTCRAGKHTDWPAEGRIVAYRSPAAAGNRKAVIHLDSHPVSELRPGLRRRWGTVNPGPQ